MKLLTIVVIWRLQGKWDEVKKMLPVSTQFSGGKIDFMTFLICETVGELLYFSISLVCLNGVQPKDKSFSSTLGFLFQIKKKKM